MRATDHDERPETPLSRAIETGGRSKFTLTEAGRTFFLPSSSRYMGGAVGLAEWQFDALPRLIDAVRKDDMVWQGFEHYISGAKGVEDEASKKRQDTFNAGLAAGAESTAKAVMAKLDLGDVKSLLDVGGNLGVFSGTLLKKYPEMKATVFDLPQVAEQVNADKMKLGMGDRLEAIGGDFTTDKLPEGHDLISFIRVFNSRTRETNLGLPERAFDALPSGGRCLFYEEHVLPENPSDFPSGALWGAMFMLSSSPGELQPMSHREKLFSDAGFSDVKGIAGRQSGIVIGTKP